MPDQILKPDEDADCFDEEEPCLYVEKVGDVEK